MATAAEIPFEETRELIANGWTPPPAALEQFRHLLLPFYRAKGHGPNAIATPLDQIDVNNIAALIATFDHFGIAIPPSEPEKAAEEPWMTVLRAYVAEQDRFSTADAIHAVGWGSTEANERSMTETLGRLGLTWTFSASDNSGVWTKRKAS